MCFFPLCFYLYTSTFSLFCSSLSVFERGGESGVAAAELTEQKIGLMLLEVCHKAGGSDYLRQIYHIIQGNEVGKHSLSPAIRWLLAWGRGLFTRRGGGGMGAAARVHSACSDLPLLRWPQGCESTVISCVVRSPHGEQRAPHGGTTVSVELARDASEEERCFFFMWLKWKRRCQLNSFQKKKITLTKSK